MADVSDIELLRNYTQQHADDAFAELVRRHIHLVYSAALRHVGVAAHAEEITQAVFVILAQKAGQLRVGVILEGWLYQTTRLTALNFLRRERRRQAREQEAFMQSHLQEPDHAPVWNQLAPLLDEAMSHLGNKDREAILLRFFKEKELDEVAAAMNISQAAAQSRVHRAVDKLQRFFFRRGVTSTATAITENISANSIQAAPAALAKTATAVAIAKGATASASTLTLIQGALKIMAWTKAKTAVVAGAIIMLAAGTTTIAVKEYQDRRTEPWQIPKVYDPANHDFEFNLSKSQVRIKPSIYQGYKVGMTDPGFGWIPRGDGTFVQTNYDHWTTIGLGATLKDIIRDAFDAQDWQIVFLTPVSQKPLYDFVSNLPHGTAQPLQQLIEKQFGIAARWETVDTNVLLLKFSNAEFPRFKPAKSLMNGMNITNVSAFDLFQGTSRDIKGTNVYINQTVGSLINQLGLQSVFGIPVVDDTAFTNRFDCLFKSPTWWLAYPEQQAYKDALHKQLGLELVPARRPVKMLVVEKAK